MKSVFKIVLNMRTVEGFVRFGQFELGMDGALAEALYESLEGKDPAGEEGFLHIDLVEMRQGLPVSLRVLSCSATELGRNVCTITRHIFRWKNLDESMLENLD